MLLKSGVIVYRNFFDDIVLIAYRTLKTKCLVMYYNQKLLRVHMLKTTDISNMIPFESIKLPIYLPLEKCINTTVDKWGKIIAQKLIMYL